MGVNVEEASLAKKQLIILGIHNVLANVQHIFHLTLVLDLSVFTVNSHFAWLSCTEPERNCQMKVLGWNMLT